MNHPKVLWLGGERNDGIFREVERSRGLWMFEKWLGVILSCGH